MLMHYKLAGIFGELSGMDVGKLNRVQETEADFKKTSFTVDEIVLDLTREYSFPIISGVDLGTFTQP